jgi:hypothetical protein
MKRWSTVIFLTAAAMLLTGCGLLYPGIFGGGTVSGGSGDPGVPTVRATYRSGHATLKITQGTDVQTITLDEVGAGSQMMSMIGGSAGWRNADGWALQVMAFDPSTMPGGMLGGMGGEVSGQMTIERITGNQVWTTQDYTGDSRCVVTVTQVDEKALSGTATCKSVRWSDGFAGSMQFGLGAPTYIAGQDPFDVDVTFEAKP